MKTLKKVLISLIAIGATACSSTRNTGIYDDDIYYTPRSNNQNPVNNNNTVTQNNNNTNSDPNQRQQNTESYTDVSGNTYITSNYYGNNNTFYQDDYYDYAYSARIRRFHSGVSFGYYDPWFTNMYWYTYDPFFFGISIYMTYSWWYLTPWVRYSWYWGWGSSWDWVPGWGWGSGYLYGYNHGYWNGYWNGYYNGLNNGLAINYYNSFDSNSWYGSRGSSSGAGNGTNTREPRSLGQIYQNATGDNPQMRQINTIDERGSIRNSGNTISSKPIDNISNIRSGNTGSGSGTKDIKSSFEIDPSNGRNGKRIDNADVSKKGRDNMSNTNPVDNIERPNTGGRNQSIDNISRTNNGRENNFPTQRESNIQPKNNYYNQLSNKPQYNYNNSNGFFSDPSRSGGGSIGGGRGRSR
jgi:hypothetical protein